MTLPAHLQTYWPAILYRSGYYNLDPFVVAGLIQFESGGNPNAISAAGAVGLGQVMPRNGYELAPEADVYWPWFTGRPTWQELKDPDTNVEWTCRILGGFTDKWGTIRQGLANYLGTIDAKGNITGADPFTGVSGEQYVNGILAYAQEYRKMDVPFITQIEPDGLGYNNCGPAALAMLAAYDGYISPTPEQMHLVADYVRDQYYDGDWWFGTYTDYPMLESYMQYEHGVGFVYHHTWEGVNRALADGRPVIILVDNSVLMPRQYPRNSAFNANHFIVLTGYDPEADTYTVNDPLAVFFGGPGYYTGASLRRAAANVGGVHAVSLEMPEDTVDPEDQEIVDVVHSFGGDASSVVGWIEEIGALKEEVGNKQGEINHLNGVNTDLQGQVDSLRQQLASCQQNSRGVPSRLEALYEDGARVGYVPLDG